MTNFNAWHDLSPGKQLPEILNAVIEIPKDSKLKYELDKESGMLRLDRFLFSAVHYPGDYGFIPQTLWEDGDPLDIIILTNRSIAYPMTIAEVRVIGIISMIDDGEKDDKLIAVYDKDPRYKEYQNVTDMPRHYLEEIKHFFESYKELEGKKCKIMEFKDKDAAFKDIKTGLELYKKKFKK